MSVPVRSEAVGREDLWKTTLYEELRTIAARHMAREREDHTLDPTAVVHEAYLRMADASWQGRTHVKAVAAQMMPRILVDHARAKGADKRGGGRARVTLSGFDEVEEGAAIDAIAVRDVLEELRRQHERQARVVELRFFGGLTLEEVAAVLGVSRDTVKLDWRFARAWMHKSLKA